MHGNSFDTIVRSVMLKQSTRAFILIVSLACYCLLMNNKKRGENLSTVSRLNAVRLLQHFVSSQYKTIWRLWSRKSKICFF